MGVLFYVCASWVREDKACKNKKYDEWGGSISYRNGVLTSQVYSRNAFINRLFEQAKQYIQKLS